jgi:Domain of unknown function (DUF6456)
MDVYSPIYVEKSLPEDEAIVTKAGKAKRTRSVRVNLAESPLSWLRAHGMLSDRLFQAGEQLRLDYEQAELGAQITMRWDAAPISAGKGARTAHHPSERALYAKQRFHQALDAAGSGLQDILWRVVCANEPMQVAEKAMGWPVRSGRIVLAIALERIADYYRLR